MKTNYINQFQREADERDSHYELTPEDKIKLLENVCRIAGVPDSIIENPQLVWGREPASEDIEWAKAKIENISSQLSSQEAKGGEEEISDLCLLIQKTIRTQCTDYDRSREYNAAIAANKVCDIVSAFFMNTKSPSQEAKGGEYKFSRDEQKKEIEKFLRASFPEDYFFVDSLDNVPLDEITEIILQYIEIHSAAASQEAKAIAEDVFTFIINDRRVLETQIIEQIEASYLSQFSSPTENEK